MDNPRNIKLVLEYDGTCFHGWQIQKEVRTVQGVLEASLSRLLGNSHKVVAASRTDAGAHARAQVANTYTQTTLPVQRILAGLNALLPGDVVVKEASEVPLDFNARRSARSRRYSYRVVVGPSALWRANAWMIRRPLALCVMEEACRAILGVRDFRAFSTSAEECESCLCAVVECEWKEWSEGYVFEI
ncbi:MAG: tRNA pseudouridine(38-40) synthase TruA [Candidatus Eiseniibacteriota bacterium]|nr:MAG: tRNA pseudouridine(38-40) synthase TruA [Candidatus Eisenbacteria bacterium]